MIVDEALEIREIRRDVMVEAIGLAFKDGKNGRR